MAGPSSTSFPVKNPKSTIRKSGFYNHQDYQNIPTGNLSNDIHPIFRKSNFQKKNAFDYAALESTLRLASHFLEQCLPVFHSILCCQPSRVATPGGSVDALPDPKKLTAEQEANTRAMLLRLAEAITFRLVAIGDTAASAQLRDECKDGMVPGHTSWINIGPTMYDAIVANFHDPKDPLDKSWSEFFFASIIVHEPAHAAENATAWSKTYETATVFLGATNEIGFEVEAFLFGGIVGPNAVNLKFYSYHGKPSGLGGLVTVYDWPCPKIVNVYEQHDANVFNQIKVRPKNPDNIYCVWDVSLIFVASLFQDSFWEGDDALDRLKPPRVTGYRFSDFEKVKGQLRKVGLEDRVSAVPQGYEVDENGLVKRKSEAKASSSELKGDKASKSGGFSKTLTDIAEALRNMPLTSGGTRLPRRYR